MSEIANKFVAIQLTRDEAKVWATGLEKGSKPEIIFAPAKKSSHNHLRQTMHQSGHSKDPADWGYFDSIIKSVEAAREILLISHGEGKANTALRFTQFVERNYPEVAKKIIGAIDSDLFAMTENQILSTAREYFNHLHKVGLPL